MHHNIKYLIFSILLVIISCVEPFNFIIQTNDKILTVDANLNDRDSSQIITLKYNLPDKDYAKFAGVGKAEVMLIENDTKKIICKESDAGIYNLPKDFKVKINNTYQLKIKIDNKNYESTKETILETPEVTNIYAKYIPDSYIYNGIKIGSHFIYIDTKDSKTLGENYIWTWENYEKISYCIKCKASWFYASRDTLVQGTCEQRNPRTNLKAIPGVDNYVYDCRTPCWGIFREPNINVLNDELINGNLIQNRLVAKIPVYNRNGTTIIVKQEVISNITYKYLNLLYKQTETNGTLVDSPPAALIGNVYNIGNQNDIVGGNFRVSSVKIAQIWVDRKDESVFSKTVEIIENDNTDFDQDNFPAGRPPKANCIKSRTRTPKKPFGWQQ